MIEGIVEGRKFLLDFSGDTLYHEFEDEQDEEFFLGFTSFCYHSVAGVGTYSLKDNLISAQACLDDLIGSGLDIQITKGRSPEYNGIKV